MFVKLASIIVDILISYEIVDAQKSRIYVYGFELLISSIAGIVALCFISVFTDCPICWIPYLLGFIPFRLTGGGYHAQSHSSCLFLFSVTYLIALLLNYSIDALSYFGVVANLYLIILFVFIAPVEAMNKPVPTERRKVLRMTGIGLAIFNILICVVVEIFFVPAKISSMYYMGNCIAGISMLVGSTSCKRRKTNEKAIS